jgi:hypothetical protein
MKSVGKKSWNSKCFAIASAVLAALLGASAAQAAVIWSNPITGSSATNPYTTGDVTDPNVTVSGISASGVSANSGTGRFNFSNWTTATQYNQNEYFAWTLTPATGYAINLSQFTWSYQTSSTGPQDWQMWASTDGGNTYTFLDLGAFGVTNRNATQDVGSTITFSTTTAASSIPFSDVTTPITFEMRCFASGSSSGTMSINQFEFDGTTASVPEPAVGGILVAAGLGILRRRRS